MLNKKSLSERDICTKFITPAIVKAGWDTNIQFLEEVSFTAGKIYVRGKLHTRGKSKRADYILYYKPNIPIAIIEAKDNKHTIGAGLQQALFKKDFRTKESADLFLIMMIHLLKMGGRAGIVLPDGSLTGEGVKQRVREKLLTDCNLHTIIRLPNSVFQPYATVATNLLFFTKGQPTREIWYYEHRLPVGQKSYSKTKTIRVEEFQPIKDWWNNRTESEIAWKVHIEKIKERGFDLDIKNPHIEEEEHEFTSREIIGQLEKSFAKSGDLLNELNAEIS